MKWFTNLRLIQRRGKFKDTIYYLCQAILIQIFHPEVWKIAKDLIAFYSDYIGGDLEIALCDLPTEHGLPESVFGMICYTAVIMWEDPYGFADDGMAYDEEDMNEDDPLVKRAEDLKSRLVNWQQNQLAKYPPKSREYYKCRIPNSLRIHKVRLGVVTDTTGNLQVLAISRHFAEPITIVISQKLLPYCAAVIPNRRGWLNPADFLLKNRIAISIGQDEDSQYLVFMFDRDILKLHDPAGLSYYENAIGNPLGELTQGKETPQ